MTTSFIFDQFLLFVFAQYIAHLWYSYYKFEAEHMCLSYTLHIATFNNLTCILSWYVQVKNVT
jgi:hypothetical protein